MITKEQFHRAKFDLKMERQREGGDPCVYDWQIIDYPGTSILRLLFVDGVIKEVDLTKYLRDYPRKELSEVKIDV